MPSRRADARLASRIPSNAPQLQDPHFDAETLHLLKKRFGSLSFDRHTTSGDDANGLHAHLVETTSQLSQETQRANDAERRCLSLLRRFRESEQARLDISSDLARTREELRLHKMRLEEASHEIDRAQKLVDDIERERSEAEQRAYEQERATRILREARLVDEAHQEGRREGLREGMAWSRKAAALQVPRRSTPRQPTEPVPVIPPHPVSDTDDDSPIQIRQSASSRQPPPPSDRTPQRQTPSHVASSTNRAFDRSSSVDALTRSRSGQETFNPTGTPAVPAVVRSDSGGRPGFSAPMRPRRSSSASLVDTPRTPYPAPSVRAPLFKDVQPPLDGFIPTVDPDDNHTIELPHPHALRRHPSAPSLGPLETPQVPSVAPRPISRAWERDAVQTPINVSDAAAAVENPIISLPSSRVFAPGVAPMSSAMTANPSQGYYSRATFRSSSSSSNPRSFSTSDQQPDFRRMDSSRTSSSAVGITIEPPSPESRRSTRSSDRDWRSTNLDHGGPGRGYLSPEHAERPLPPSDIPFPPSQAENQPQPRPNGLPLQLDPTDFDALTRGSNARSAQTPERDREERTRGAATPGAGNDRSYSTPSSDYFLRDGQVHRDYAMPTTVTPGAGLPVVVQTARMSSMGSDPPYHPTGPSRGAGTRTRLAPIEEGQTNSANSVYGAQDVYTSSSAYPAPGFSSQNRGGRSGYDPAPLPPGFTYPDPPAIPPTRSASQARNTYSNSTVDPRRQDYGTGDGYRERERERHEQRDDDRESPPLYRPISMFNDSSSESNSSQSLRGRSRATRSQRDGGRAGMDRGATPSSRWSASRPTSRAQTSHSVHGKESALGSVRSTSVGPR